MPVGATTAVLLAGAGGLSAGASIMGGNAQAKSIQKQAEYNAQVYEQQASMIQEKKKIQDYQFNRQAARARGSIIAKTAGKGFNMGGSPLAILADNESQMQFDKAIGDYNLNVEQNYALSGAANTRQQGVYNARAARYSGYTNAFSTVLNTGLNYGLMNMSNPLATTGLSPKNWWGGRA